MTQNTGVWPQWYEHFLVEVGDNCLVELCILVDEEDLYADLERKLQEAVNQWASDNDEGKDIVVEDWKVLQILN